MLRVLDLPSMVGDVVSQGRGFVSLRGYLTALSSHILTVAPSLITDDRAEGLIFLFNYAEQTDFQIDVSQIFPSVLQFED